MKGLGAAANKSLLLSENIWPKPRGGLEGELPNGLVFCCAGARPGAGAGAGLALVSHTGVHMGLVLPPAPPHPPPAAGLERPNQLGLAAPRSGSDTNMLGIPGAGAGENTGPGSGAAAGAAGESSAVVRNRSSSSARAEYLSPAALVTPALGGAAAGGGSVVPVLGLRGRGGSVAELGGGWVRGSETLLVG